MKTTEDKKFYSSDALTILTTILGFILLSARFLTFTESGGINVSKRENHVTFVVLFCPRPGGVHVSEVNGSNSPNLL